MEARLEEGVYYHETRIGSLKDLKIELTNKFNPGHGMNYHSFYDISDCPVTKIQDFLKTWKPLKTKEGQEWMPLRTGDDDDMLYDWRHSVRELGHINRDYPTMVFLSGDTCYIINSEGQKRSLRHYRETQYWEQWRAKGVEIAEKEEMEEAAFPEFSCIVAGVRLGYPFGYAEYLEDQYGLAREQRWVIGHEGKVPWKCPPDMAYFVKKTTETTDPGKVNAVIMGRKTWDSIPETWRPLKNRLNIIISKTLEKPAGCQVFPDFEKALEWLQNDEKAKTFVESNFVIGGGQLYTTAVDHPGCSAIYFTEIEPDGEEDFPDNLDTKFPQINPLIYEKVLLEKEFQEIKGGNSYRFVVYKRKKEEKK